MELLFKCFKIIILFFAFANAGYAQQSVINPLLIHSNDPVRFNKVTVAVIHEVHLVQGLQIKSLSIPYQKVVV